MPRTKNQPSLENKTELKAPAAEPQCREVDFVLGCNGAEHAYVCGGFNDWHPTWLRMSGNPPPASFIPAKENTNFQRKQQKETK